MLSCFTGYFKTVNGSISQSEKKSLQALNSLLRHSHYVLVRCKPHPTTIKHSSRNSLYFFEEIKEDKGLNRVELKNLKF